MNRLPLTTIGGKTLINIWSGEASQDYSLLWEFGCPVYFGVKDDMLNLQAKKFVFFECQIFFGRLQARDSKNKKIMLSRYVTFDGASLLKSTTSEQEKRMKTKDVSRRVEIIIGPKAHHSSFDDD